MPALGWAPHYQRAWLSGDLVGGLTVVALLVPEGMAYAQLAGVPPETVFYAAPVGLLLYALLGTSRQLVFAVSSAVAVLSASVVGDLAHANSARYLALTSALAILVGVVSIVAGLLRAGRIALFFSESVMTGFVFGLALFIAIKQVPKVFGIPAGDGGFFERLWDLVVHLGDTQGWTLLVGATSIVLMLVLERFVPRLPAALVALVYGIAIATLFDLGAKGVAVLGDIPAGLVGPSVPNVTGQDLLDLLPGAIGIALVVFAEGLGPDRSFARRHHYTIDPDQELVAMGAGNAGAGFFQGFPIGASLSKSAANDGAGAQSAFALVVAAGVTALVALFLTSLFENLPEATLAAVVIVAILPLLDVGEMLRLWRLRRHDFIAAMTAMLGVLVLGVLQGLVVAVVLSLVLLIARASRPDLAVLGRSPDHAVLGDLRRHPDYETVPGLLVVRPNEPLFFANASPLRDRIVDLVRSADPPVRRVVLDLELTADLDVPGADVLVDLIDELNGMDVQLSLAGISDRARELLDQHGLTERIGPHHFHVHAADAVRRHVESGGDG